MVIHDGQKNCWTKTLKNFSDYCKQGLNQIQSMCYSFLENYLREKKTLLVRFHDKKRFFLYKNVKKTPVISSAYPLYFYKWGHWWKDEMPSIYSFKYFFMFVKKYFSITRFQKSFEHNLENNSPVWTKNVSNVSLYVQYFIWDLFSKRVLKFYFSENKYFFLW